MTSNKKPAFTADEQRCFDQLEEWNDAFTVLLAFIGPTTYIAEDKEVRHSGAWADDVRTQYQTLKRQLHAEAERLGDAEQRDALNEAESRFYVRAILQADAYLTLDPKSTNGDEWRHQLGEAQMTIRYPLFQLKEKRESASGKEER